MADDIDRRTRPAVLSTGVEERRLGRPRAEEPGSAVTTWLRQSEHDQLIRLAQKHETTISSLVRSLLILKLR